MSRTTNYNSIIGIFELIRSLKKKLRKFVVLEPSRFILILHHQVNKRKHFHRHLLKVKFNLNRNIVMHSRVIMTMSHNYCSSHKSKTHKPVSFYSDWQWIRHQKRIENDTKTEQITKKSICRQICSENIYKKCVQCIQNN